MMQLKLIQERAKIQNLEKTHTERIQQIYEKMMSIMLSRCYKTLRNSAAREFLEDLQKNRTSIDFAAYVPVNFKYYEDPKADLSLNADEIFINRLLNAVFLYLLIKIKTSKEIEHNKKTKGHVLPQRSNYQTFWDKLTESKLFTFTTTLLLIVLITYVCIFSNCKSS